MKTVVLAFSMILNCSLWISAQDIRGKVGEGAEVGLAKQLIDPNHSILGLKVGALEEEVLAELGDPDAYVRLNRENTAAIYDNSKAYIFTDDRLSGIRISHSLIDHQLVKAFSSVRLLSQFRWKLDNGIREEMSLPDVRKILGDKLKPDEEFPSKHQQYYEDGDSVVFLYFSHYVARGEEDSAYRVSGILVKPKG